MSAVYQYYEKIKGKTVLMFFNPNLRAEVAFEDNHSGYFLDVTEKTKKITTSLGAEWDKEFNRILKKCQKDYIEKKRKEIRLYFYDATSNKLRLCYLSDTGFMSVDNYEYSLERESDNVPYCAIDKKYARPNKDVFILGRVVRTVGTKDYKLMDFVEPVYEIELDFVKEEWDCGEYGDSISYLEQALFELLKFTVSKNYSPLEIANIQAYLKCRSEEAVFIARQFIINIMDAFSSGDADRVRKLYEVLKKH